MQGKRILIVDDEAQIALTLCRALSLPLGGGHHVEVSPSAYAALTRFPRERFDLIITDLRMPGISGLELIRRVRQNSPQTRTILITAYGDDEVEAEVRRLQVCRYVTKPFRIAQFILIVREVLASPRTIAARPMEPVEEYKLAQAM